MYAWLTDCPPLYVVLLWVRWGGPDGLSIILKTYLPSVLWHCWLGRLTCKHSSRYDLFGGTLNQYCYLGLSFRGQDQDFSLKAKAKGKGKTTWGAKAKTLSSKAKAKVFMRCPRESSKAKARPRGQQDCVKPYTTSSDCPSVQCLQHQRPMWGRGTPLPPLSIYFIFSPFYFFLMMMMKLTADDANTRQLTDKPWCCAAVYQLHKLRIVCPQNFL